MKITIFLISLFLLGCSSGTTDINIIENNSIKDSSLNVKGNSLYFGDSFYRNVDIEDGNVLIKYGSESYDADVFEPINDSIFCFETMCLSRNAFYIYFNSDLRFVCMYGFYLPEMEVMSDSIFIEKGTLYSFDEKEKYFYSTIDKYNDTLKIDYKRKNLISEKKRFYELFINSVYSEKYSPVLISSKTQADNILSSINLNIAAFRRANGW